MFDVQWDVLAARNQSVKHITFEYKIFECLSKSLYEATSSFFVVVVG